MEIAVPFVQIEAINPNLGITDPVDSSSIYFKCILVCFATLRKFNTKAKLVLYTNQYPPTNIIVDLNKLSVEIRIYPYTYMPTEAFGNKFKGCFYLFDAIQNSQTSTLFIDPDVIAIESLSRIEVICREKYGIFLLDFQTKIDVNGLTPEAAAQIFTRYCEEIGELCHQPYVGHIGGEAIYIPEKKLIELSSKISKFWTWNLAAANRGEKFLTTEEHILTNILSAEKYELLNPFISRIWTTKKFTNHQGNEDNILNLKLWHLPAEKTRGFISMHKLLSSQNFEIHTNKVSFINLAKRMMNIDKRTNLILSCIFSQYQKLRQFF